MGVEIGFALLTGLLGVLMARTTLCSVTCLQQLVVARRADGVLRLVVATSAAGVTLLALSLWSPAGAWLPASQPVGFPLIAGGVLLGLGAAINGSCYLGSVLYLGRGNLNFLFTLVGLLLAFRYASMTIPMEGGASFRQSMGPWVLVGLAMYALLLAAGTWAGRRATGSRTGAIVETRSEARRAARGAVAAALGTGVVAALVYSQHPQWNYGSVLESLANAHQQPVGWAGESAALTLFAGATLGAITAQRFRLEPVRLVRALRCLVGGALMGLGASHIPGGHDVLLLWSIPGLALHGVVAYLVMAITLSALLFASALLGLGRKWRQRH